MRDPVSLVLLFFLITVYVLGALWGAWWAWTQVSPWLVLAGVVSLVVAFFVVAAIFAAGEDGEA